MIYMTFFCNVAFASIRGINSLSLSLERSLREGAAYFIYGLGSARVRITAPGQRVCLHSTIPSSPTLASCPARGCLLPFDPHLPVKRHSSSPPQGRLSSRLYLSRSLGLSIEEVCLWLVHTPPLSPIPTRFETLSPPFISTRLRFDSYDYSYS